jgi:hypothetical protein
MHMSVSESDSEILCESLSIHNKCVAGKKSDGDVAGIADAAKTPDATGDASVTPASASSRSKTPSASLSGSPLALTAD